MMHVVASDLDGTLLTPEHNLSPYTKQVLQALRKKDIHFVFATGRHHIDVAQMRENMEIDAFMITSNGARVHDSQGNLVFSQSIEPSLASQIAQMSMDDPLIYTHLYRGDDWLINKEDTFSLAFYRHTQFTYQLFNPLDFDTTNIAKIYFTTTDNALYQHLVQLKNRLETKFGNKISVAFSTLNCLEVMAENVSKGSALKNVVEKLGYSLKDSIAFGDGMNDYEMLKVAGKGCIMQNGSAELKKLLPELEVIGSNAQDAVPHYLSKLFL
ncbi:MULTISPECIES: Cof-type HAD-IIB family hydrolase [unclassified Gilliamella]|uniref:Cof-type HAD-IIB family hydrolase n=1 Tax=unclassified Gilliamella TaxID=2685620 RepID=UPI00130A7233|nr:Cof-type HAD-IIB family hydrolase [Gilliamella sp. Lep-s35]MWP68217.1 Cof-type HAD-IIB family hydrolase [Gilliamella sp. Lep-s5]MWP76437.1 Cof-type HAD-IIB family hydrolase [Gilliamella sp. Lep-s21]